ncbi:MAG: dTDP-4-dehydrorhamnose reductase [Planctomycetota bacterium]
MAETAVAILGGRGMLGTDLVDLCKKQRIPVAVFDLPEFDITDRQQLRRAVESSDMIINCAAYTDVEKAETETELAYRLNAQAVGELGRLAAQNGKWVLHISTDFVFDGALSRPYRETDPTGPLNVYGKTKLAGEKLLMQSRCDHCIVRLQWTYGKAGRNFVKKILDRAKQGGPINVVDDQIGTPTATTAVAKAVCDLLPKKPFGLFHFAAAGYASRFDVAEFILDESGIDVNLNRCRTADYPTAAQRPLNSRFDCGKISAILDQPVEHWQGPLKRFLEEINL